MTITNVSKIHITCFWVLFLDMWWAAMSTGPKSWGAGCIAVYSRMRGKRHNDHPCSGAFGLSLMAILLWCPYSVVSIFTQNKPQNSQWPRSMKHKTGQIGLLQCHSCKWSDTRSLLNLRKIHIGGVSCAQRCDWGWGRLRTMALSSNQSRLLRLEQAPLKPIATNTP